MTIQRNNKQFPFRSYRGGTPSTSELRDEIEELYKFLERDITLVAGSAQDAITSQESALSVLDALVRDDTRLNRVFADLAEMKETLNRRLVVIEKKIIPVGLIAIWKGLLVDIPTGWALCDGSNGTPDFRDKFIVGASAGNNPGGTGGTSSHSHAVGTLAMSSDSAGTPVGLVTVFMSSTDAHTTTAVQSGSGTTVVTGPASHSVAAPSANFTGSAMAAHTHTIIGDTDTEDHLPPFYEVAFIMKLAD